MSRKEIIKTVNLSYRYQNNAAVLKNINISVKAGEMVAVVGQNGAGKTTLVKHFNGLLKPTSGQVLVNGCNTSNRKISDLARHVGFVFQNPDHQIFHDSVEKEVAFGLSNAGFTKNEICERVEEALTAVKLIEKRTVYPYELSKGQRQRLALASVLAVRSEVIVLDEPTTGQDYRESRQIMKMITDLNQSGHTIIFITHDMSLVAEFAQRVIVLCQGEVLIDGPVREVFTKPQLLARSFLELPPVIRLAQNLELCTDSSCLLTVDEVYHALLHSMGGETNGFNCRISPL